MSIPLSPLEAMWSGILYAWAFVLGPSSGLVFGTILGLFAAGWERAGIPIGATPAFGAVAVPMAMFGSNLGQLLAIITAVAILGFWGSEKWRTEAWLTLCLTGGIQTFLLFAGEADVWQFIRISIACAILAAIHAAATMYPAWRYGDKKTRHRKRRKRVALRIRYRLTKRS
jgi:hypothetical protein